jgi:hypothetical protein
VDTRLLFFLVLSVPSFHRFSSTLLRSILDAAILVKAHLDLAVHIHTLTSKCTFQYTQEVIERTPQQMLAMSSRVKSGVASYFELLLLPHNKVYIGQMSTPVGAKHSQYMYSKHIPQQIWCQHECI